MNVRLCVGNRWCPVAGIVVGDVIPTGILFERLDTLYNEVPPAPCLPFCGECCTSPHVTFFEFLNYLHFLVEECSEELRRDFLSRPMSEHRRFAGNYVCRFQSDEADKGCRAYPARSYICRLQGHRVVDLLGIENQENCDKARGPLPHIPIAQADAWLDRLAALNRELVPFYEPPYFVSALNIETWLDLMVLRQIPSHSFFSKYSATAEKMVDLSTIKQYYQSQTGILVKIECIQKFYEAIEAKEHKKMFRLGNQIRTGFLRTGSYFITESLGLEKAATQGD